MSVGTFQTLVQYLRNHPTQQTNPENPMSAGTFQPLVQYLRDHPIQHTEPENPMTAGSFQPVTEYLRRQPRIGIDTTFVVTGKCGITCPGCVIDQMNEMQMQGRWPALTADEFAEFPRLLHEQYPVRSVFLQGREPLAPNAREATAKLLQAVGW